VSQCNGVLIGIFLRVRATDMPTGHLLCLRGSRFVAAPLIFAAGIDFAQQESDLKR
jgi:hypothetical protein